MNTFDIALRKTLYSGQRHFDLDVHFRSDSKRVVIFGASGAGKSLTLKAIAGLLRPDAGHIHAGQILFDAAAGIDLPARARRVGYVFQDYALFPHLDVRQNIAFGLTHGLRNPGRDADVGQWLAAFHLEDVAHQHPHQLSGGQRQRTALARAVANHPQVLLLDEPFAALDPDLRVHLREELDALLRRLDIPMILITHDREDARRLGEHVIELRAGRVVEGA